MTQRNRGIGLALVLVGLFGIAFAISGVLTGLPRPAVGGTCGPGASSESSIVALFNPGSIGAGQEPATSSATDRANWMAFVGECQASADGRVLATLVILLASAGAAVGGLLLVREANRRLPVEPATAQFVPTGGA